jgi:spore coat protein A
MLAPSERADLIVDFADHLHGAKAPAESDGYPENWYVPGKSALYHYPNHRDAAMLWYHAGEKKG